MGGNVAVVTDSTAYLPEGVTHSLDVRVVPLSVVLGGVAGEEGSEVTPAAVARALGDRRRTVTTSRPAPQRFHDVYRRAFDEGAAGIVSVHLSRRLSGTFASARQAVEELALVGRVRVVDSGSAAMGLGFAVLAAAEAARDGGSLAEVYLAAARTAARTTTLFCVDTLEHLWRGGRIGAARALFGTALSVKPILRIADGRIVPVEKVRTAARGIARLEALAVQAAGDGPVDVAVHHLAAPDRAEALSARLRERLPRLRRLLASEVGAVVGAHVGPGVVGVVVARL